LYVTRDGAGGGTAYVTARVPAGAFVTAPDASVASNEKLTLPGTTPSFSRSAVQVQLPAASVADAVHATFDRPADVTEYEIVAMDPRTVTDSFTLYVLTVALAFGLAHEAAIASGVGEAGAPGLAPALAATLMVADGAPPEADGLAAEPHAARTTPHRINPASWADRLGRLMLVNPSTAVAVRHVHAQDAARGSFATRMVGHAGTLGRC